jgi:mono/diheme cytochrome c family protein
MNRKKIIWLQTILFVLIIMAAGCTKNGGGDTSSLYVPTSTDVTPNATLQELQQGRALYIDNCGACHGLYNPDSYSASQWGSILNSMGPKTSMSSSEVQLVKKYLTRGQ